MLVYLYIIPNIFIEGVLCRCSVCMGLGRMGLCLVGGKGAGWDEFMGGSGYGWRLRW